MTRTTIPLALIALTAFVVGCSNGTRDPSGVARIDEHHTLGAPVTVGNLTVWPVHTDDPIDVGEFRTLHEAIEEGKAEIREVGGGQNRAQVLNDAQIDEAAQTEQNDAPPRQVVVQSGFIEDLGGDVNIANGSLQIDLNGGGATVGTLVIENKGELPILVCAGTIVKGGNQDRQIGEDFVIPAAQIVPVEAFCVEQSRWTANRLGASTDGKFVPAKMNAVAGVRMKGQYMKDQGGVWQEVAKVKQEATIVVGDADIGLGYGATANFRALPGSTSLAVALDANDEAAGKDLERIRKAVLAHFEPLGDDAVGFAYAVDGKPVSVRTFAHARVFKDQFDPFLRSMSSEALLAERSRKEGDAEPPVASAEDVVRLVEEINSANEEISETAGMNDNGVRRADAGFNGNCYIEISGNRKVALTRDWSGR